MRVLAVDHHFEQDLDALSKSNPGHHLDVVHKSVFLDPAQKCFPQRTFAELSAYRNPESRPYRLKWAHITERLITKLHKRYKFDLLVVPSDSIFYLRAAIRMLSEAGIPTVVVQKETAMSPWTIRAFAKDIGRQVPFVADVMTVNSALHKEFWVVSGAPADKILVTGQPRFDYYASDVSHPGAIPRLGISPDRKTVVFLSYLLWAYNPDETDIWTEQRTATEKSLIEQCKQSGALLIVKPHPQQPVEGYLEQLRRAGADVGVGVRLADPSVDTRVLLSAADVVVGFQSTAMYEAIACGKPTIYAGWAPEADEIKEELLPLWDLQPTLTVAESSEHLRRLVARQLDAPTPIEGAASRHLVEEQLGPLDGGACGRVWSVLEDALSGGLG